MSEKIEDERGVTDGSTGKGSPLETFALHRGTYAGAGGDHTMQAEKQFTEDRTFFPAPGDPLNFVRSRKRPVRNSDIVKQSFENSDKAVHVEFSALMRWH